MDKSILNDMLTGTVVIACVGNELCGDDGVGPFISRLIKESESVHVVDCGETPENYLGVIVGFKPEKVVVIDVAEFGGAAGEIRLVKKSEITGGGASTHDAILTLFTDFIEHETGAQTFFLAIQPARREVGEGLSPTIEAAGREVATAINNILKTP
ncbi:MAG: hydrogenase 3 maturation endopeptidase HyCI [Candidatus Eisenbacteria bacterium]